MQLPQQEARDFVAARNIVMKRSCFKASDCHKMVPDAAQVSSAMGFGFRCGFLGLLHMEIVQERLEREYDVDLIVTSPTVVYRCNLMKGETLVVQNPTLLPDAGVRESIEEPYCRCWSSLIPDDALVGRNLTPLIPGSVLVAVRPTSPILCLS